LEALIGPCFSEEELSRQADRKEELYRSIMKRDMKPHTGLIEFLASLRREGIRMAVATSGPQDNASLILDGLNIRHFFGVVVTGADVSRSKPDPEIFLLAAGKMGVNPERCVVFEDSVAGIQAARSAGYLCIGVATTHTEEELEPLHPCQIISDFVGLRPADLGVFLQT
jgi:HAD superfamily hydrolase (TIGR01509 family)